MLQTDASAVGLGAVLEQGGHVIAYASQTLTKSESNYTVIQRECLAAVFGMKQFRHYLLGHFFTLMTDHAPLQWLSAQKMEGLLQHWALAMQEYAFDILYRKGAENSLSRNPVSVPASVAVTSSQPVFTDIPAAQLEDLVVKQLHSGLSSSSKPVIIDGTQPLLKRYLQMWQQLLVIDDVVCRIYTPRSSQQSVIVPVLPPSLQQSAISHIPTAGHQGIAKTLQ